MIPTIQNSPDGSGMALGLCGLCSFFVVVLNADR